MTDELRPSGAGTEATLYARFIKQSGQLPPAIQSGGLSLVGVEYFFDLFPDATARRSVLPLSRSQTGSSLSCQRERHSRVLSSDVLPFMSTHREGRVVLPTPVPPPFDSDSSQQLILEFEDTGATESRLLGKTNIARPLNDMLTASVSESEVHHQPRGLKMRQRAIILRKSGDQFASLYVVELTLHGYSVEVYDNHSDLLDALNRGQEVRIIVLDTPAVGMHDVILGGIYSQMKFSPPVVIWRGDRNPSAGHGGSEFNDRLVGPRDTVKLVLRGNYANFKSRLDFMEAWLHINKLPLLLIRHSLQLLQPRIDERTERGRSTRPRVCDPREQVSDLVVEGVSLLAASRRLRHPISRFDLYLFDWLEQVGDAVSASEMVRAIRSGTDYSFAHRLTEEVPGRLSEDTVQTAMERLQGGMELFGLEGDRVILEEGRKYRIDRAVVRVEIEHFRS